MSRHSVLLFVVLLVGVCLTRVGLTAPAPGPTGLTSLSLSDLEDQVFEAINLERRAGGLPSLRRAGDLNAVARQHSRDMVARSYFAHTSPEGDDLRQRFARSGISNWRCIAENIAYNRGYPDPVAAVVEGWMRSPGHRRNILNRQLTESGIGVAVDEGGRTYFTQVFTARDQKLMARAW